MSSGRGVKMAVLGVALPCLLCAPPPVAVAQTPFGIVSFNVQTTRATAGAGPGGQVQEPYAFTQAGGHPQALTASVEFAGETVAAGGQPQPAGEPRDLAIEMPPGLTANPLAVPRCPLPQALRSGDCPAETQVGVYALRLFDGQSLFGPIVELTPETGQTAELALEVSGADLLLTGRLASTAAGYGLAILARGLPPIGAQSVQLTLWGVPAAQAHDPQRGLSCSGESSGKSLRCEGGGERSDAQPLPFLTMPSDCAFGPVSATASADSWQEPSRWAQASATLPAASGCGQLAFAPGLQVQPEARLAGEPEGVGIDLLSPQSEGVETPATSPLRAASVTLPQGLALNPAAVGGLRACPASGLEGIEIPTGLSASGQPLSPEEAGEGEEVGPDELARLAPGHCPQASRVGTAEATTPLLPQPLRGALYLAQPLCGGAAQPPCTEADAGDGRLVRVYLELDGGGEPGPDGLAPPAPQAAASVVVKLEGHVDLDPATGQPTLVLPEAPQLPLSRLAISLTGGPRALLANPATCGPATTTADLTPWSAPGVDPAGLFTAGAADATPSSSYDVLGCQTPAPLHPGFLAGTVSSIAGAFSPLVLAVTSSSSEQSVSAIQIRTPPGLFARLAGVPLCGAAAAAVGEWAGRCPIQSRIGSSAILAGAGSAPLEVAGQVYLTGPYLTGPYFTGPSKGDKGAPFGLAIVTPIDVGPFQLGSLVLRARIAVDPESGALTITTDPLPQMLDGIPLRLRRLSIEIDRPRFVFNPTSCDAQQISATVTGAQGATAELASPFAAGGCRGLAFDPRIEAAARLPRGNGDAGERRVSRPGGVARTAANGGAVALDVKLSFPAAAQGTQANLARLDVTLPRQLPSRLEALQHACPKRVFAANPARCPSGSVAGIVRASTPALPGTLAGPIYFVSHGAGGYPAVVAVLQGDGIQLRLAGVTRVTSKQRIGVDFSALPDVPLRAAQLYLPAGPHAMLGAAQGACAGGGRLSMGVTLAAQNGAVVRRSVSVGLAGCPVSKVKHQSLR